ncbi:MAG: lipoate--protein ligase [Bacteroidales bacterium]|nr:lipoate--protein ligase [Bacteroidales bacterium]
MRFLWLTTQNPHFNLAVEEYLLTQTQDDVFMLWQNDNSVIIGRHQNTLAEINLDFVEKENIVIARRLTGGGAVFHDLGNLNFSFIQNINPNEKEIDFVKYLQPIVDALQSLGVPAAFSGRNDLVIYDKKISGNAMVFYGNRVLEHGTLLFSTVQNNLAQALKVDPSKFNDKAVKSVRSRVTNISEYLPQPMTVLEFKDYLMDFILKQNQLKEVDGLSAEEQRIVSDLCENKFSTWEWNYGQSPKYAFDRKLRTKGGSVEAMMNVQNGRIADLRFFGDFFSRKNPEDLVRALIGVPHVESEIRAVLYQNPVEEYFNGATLEEILSLLM